MKYLEYFEKIKNKNISVGRIYRMSGVLYVGNPPYTKNKKLIPLVKILSIDGNLLNVKTYFEESKEEYIFNCYKTNFANIASPEEIDYFNSIENSKKYNL